MKLLITAEQTKHLHDDKFSVQHSGPSQIRRASCVEPWFCLSEPARQRFLKDNPIFGEALHQDGSTFFGPGHSWFADLGPSHGPVLGPFQSRSAALEAERRWLEDAYTAS